MAEQTQRLSQAMETSAESALDALFVVVTQAYLEYPALRPIFDEREAIGPIPTLDIDMTYRANTLAEMLLDVMDRAIVFSDRGLSGASTSLDAWITDSFRHSTFLRAWYTEHAGWYGSRFDALLVKAAAELEVSRVEGITAAG
ncbi:hypothetical protein HCA58_22900 [Micromonospora sp. HNM0581]|uniref:hypothetical protein n=1 Tax=Micromonospora sp. HNM0581 TaxID=2716341 RepID=UPI00146E336F|nr:hypothetical protein [Micromonospora sp. HNM0581]NLU81137.1 hypothetical protein [Micromonospora sp. HNM0581]